LAPLNVTQTVCCMKDTSLFEHKFIEESEKFILGYVPSTVTGTEVLHREVKTSDGCYSL
jgi:hypothetical protein